MSQSLASRLQQSVRTLELIEKVVKGPASGPDSEVTLAPGVRARTLARRVSEMTFGLESAADADVAILAPQSGDAYTLRGLSLVAPLTAQVIGPNIRVTIDLSDYATDAHLASVAEQLSAAINSMAAEIDAFDQSKAGLAYVDSGLEQKVSIGSTLSALSDGGGFVRMTDVERAKLSLLAVNFKGSYVSLAALTAANADSAAGDWAIITHGPGEPATFAAWDDDNVPAGWVDTGASAPTTIDWTNITNKPETFSPSTHDHPDKALAARTIVGAGLATGGGDLSADRTITVPKSSQGEAEAATDDASAMTPLRVADREKKSELTCKAWVRFAGSNGAIAGSFGVASVVRNSTGSYTVTLSNAMNSVNYTPVANVTDLNGPEVSIAVESKTAFAISVTARTIGGLTDPTNVFAAVFGNRE